MKQLLLLIMLLLGVNFNTYSCCSAGQYRLFPLGISESKIIVAEFRLSRFCEVDGKMGEGMGEGNIFLYRGVVNLGYFNGDSVVFIANIDTLEVNECECEYMTVVEKSELAENLIPYYQKALNQAMLLPDFEAAVPLSYQYHDKDEPINGMWFENDTIIELQTTDGAMELYPVNWGPMGYLTRITEVKTYDIAGDTVTVINLSVNADHNLTKEKIQSNTKRFKQLNTALTYCVTQFHGYNSDYIILR